MSLNFDSMSKNSSLASSYFLLNFTCSVQSYLRRSASLPSTFLCCCIVVFLSICSGISHWRNLWVRCLRDSSYSSRLLPCTSLLRSFSGCWRSKAAQCCQEKVTPFQRTFFPVCESAEGRNVLLIRRAACLEWLPWRLWRWERYVFYNIGIWVEIMRPAADVVMRIGDSLNGELTHCREVCTATDHLSVYLPPGLFVDRTFL